MKKAEMKMIQRYNKDTRRFRAISADYCGGEAEMKALLETLRRENRGVRYRLVDCEVVPL